MPEINANGVRLFYEEFGDQSQPPMLLIMGLGMQMLGWDRAFCEQLASRGFRVIRFDNRDVGLSSRHSPDVQPDIAAIWSGDHSSVAYSLDDMAGDVVGLLDALVIDAAHIVGASMGAMIGQIVALSFPERVLSLASMMGSTGDIAVGQAHADLLPVLLAPPTDSPEEDAVRLWRAIGSPAFPLSERQIRHQVRAALERELEPSGALRQFAAVVSAADRTEVLGLLRMPVVVIHGALDPLIDVSGGRATAAAIPDAELVILDEMAHDLPAALWPQFLDAIVSNAHRADTAP